MIITEQRTIPEHTETVVKGYRCDICGKETKQFDNWEGYAHKDKNFGVSQTTVSITNGYRYPECYATTTTEYDICSTCFRDKLIPWLAAQGATDPRVEESDG